MLATKDEITQYIPQRDPIIMVHNLLEASDEHAITQLYVDPGNVFVFNGYFAEPGMVENIAQTAAVHIGFSCMKKGLPIPIGYIASIKDLKINSLPPTDKLLTTTVRIINKVMDLTVAEGKVEFNGEIFCSCEMRIFAKTKP